MWDIADDVPLVEWKRNDILTIGDAIASGNGPAATNSFITHPSVIKTTFLLYFATPAGMTAACDAMGAVSIIGLWKPYV